MLCIRCGMELEEDEKELCSVCKIEREQQGEELFAKDMNDLYGEECW